MTQHTVVHESGESVARAFFDAWSARDADALASLFAEDAHFVNVVGLWWRNARQIRKAHDYGFKRIFGQATLELTELVAREITEDVHVVITTSTLSGQVGPGGEPVGDRVAVITMVAQRTDLGFVIVSCQNTDRVEGADTHVRDAGGFRPASYLSNRQKGT